MKKTIAGLAMLLMAGMAWGLGNRSRKCRREPHHDRLYPGLTVNNALWSSMCDAEGTGAT